MKRQIQDLRCTLLAIAVISFQQSLVAQNGEATSIYSYVSPGGEILIVPAYRSESGSMWGGMSSNDYATVYSEKWLKQFNKHWHPEIGSNNMPLVFRRRVPFDPWAVILIPYRLVNYFDSLDRGLVKSYLTERIFSGSELRGLYEIELALTNNPSFTKRTPKNEKLASALEIDYDYSLTCNDADVNEQGNGEVSLQLYSIHDSLPIAYFEGHIENNVPSGYGCLIRQDWHDGGVFKSPRYGFLTQSSFERKRGFWKNGKFLHTTDAGEVARSYGPVLVQRIAGYETHEDQIYSRVVAAEVPRDWLNDSLGNGYDYWIYTSWPLLESERAVTDAVQWKRGHFLYWHLYTDDFSDTLPTITVMDGDPMAMKTIRENSSGSSGVPFLDFLKSAVNREETTCDVDDYTRVSKTGRIPTRYLPCGAAGSETEYYSKFLTISIRNRRDAPWERVARYEIIDRWRDCLEVGNAAAVFERPMENILRLPNLYLWDDVSGTFGEQMGTSWSHAETELIERVKREYPAPDGDTTISMTSRMLRSRFFEIGIRAGRGRYRFNPSDPLAGVWLTHYVNPRDGYRADRLIFIEHGSDPYCYVLSDDNQKLRQPNNNYVEALEQADLIVKGRSVSLNTRYFLCGGKDFEIKSLTRGILQIKSGCYWERLE